MLCNPCVFSLPHLQDTPVRELKELLRDVSVPKEGSAQKLVLVDLIFAMEPLSDDHKTLLEAGLSNGAEVGVTCQTETEDREAISSYFCLFRVGTQGSGRWQWWCSEDVVNTKITDSEGH